MDEIKSAAEIAMEKVAKLGEATNEDRLKWKYVPEGEKLAVRYLKQECELVAELGKYDENARPYLIDGAEDILIRNISLPKNDITKKNNKLAMDGLKALKQDKVSVENVYSKMRRVFSHYEEQGEMQKRQAYESLKAEFEAKVKQALQQQLGTSSGIAIDVERQPQFQEEWRRLLGQLESQYYKLIDEYKQELAAIP